MFCDYYNAQQKVYCKRLKVLCPEHTKEPKVSTVYCSVSWTHQRTQGKYSILFWVMNTPKNPRLVQYIILCPNCTKEPNVNIQVLCIYINITKKLCVQNTVRNQGNYTSSVSRTLIKQVSSVSLIYHKNSQQKDFLKVLFP